MRRLLPLLFLPACEPQPPFVCGPVPELTVLVGERAEADLCIEDPEGELLDFDTFIDNPVPVTQVQITNLGRLSLLGRSPGTAIISVTATDPDGLGIEVAVRVLVPNHPPAGSLDDLEISPRFRETIFLTDHFSDPDGQELHYQASSSAPSVVHADVLPENLLRLTPLEDQGSARISLSVSDGLDTVNTTFEATIVPPVVLLSDEFDSAASLADWTLADYSRAEIADGYLVLTADSADYIGLAEHAFGGTAGGWIIDIKLRTTDAHAQAGFLVDTDSFPNLGYMLLLGETSIPGFPPLNWIFMWWDGYRNEWVTDDWANGKSGHIRDFADMEVSLTMMRSGVRATVNGKRLFEHGRAQFLTGRAVRLFLVTRPEGEGGVTSSMNRVHFITRKFTEGSSLGMRGWLDKADRYPLRR